MICFSNNGEHISKENINKMFDRFYRIDTSRSASIPGSGLGLAICKRIIELHDGRIWAESEEEIITIKIELNISKSKR